MAFSQKNNSEDEIVSEINLTPLIDIMLVLLIIFMVTSSVSLESGLDIDLPKTTSQTSSKEGNSVIISMDAAEKVYIQGNEISYSSLEDLEVEISKALSAENTRTVIFEGSAQSTLEKAIRVMDIAKKAGAEKFAIAAQGEG